MNIIHFTGMRSAKFGALEKFFVELATQLQITNQRLILVYEEEPSYEPYIEQLTQQKAIIEILNTKNSNQLSSILSIIKILKKYRPEIIHTHFDPAGYLALVASSAMGIPVRIKTMHGMLYGGSQKNNIININQLSHKTRFLKKLMYRLSTHIFSVSEGIKIQFYDIFRLDTKIKTLYLGVSENNLIKKDLRDLYGIEPKLKIITCIAFHSKVKGVDVLLNAIHILKNHYSTPPFIVHQIGGGDPTYTQELKSLALELKIENLVCWLGLRNDVTNLLSLSDICCQPSRSEGISMALMEASMASLPIVASQVGGIPEVVEDMITGFLVPIEDSEALAAKIAQLLNDENLCIKMGTDAKHVAIKKFNLTQQVSKLIEEYDLNIKA